MRQTIYYFKFMEISRPIFYSIEYFSTGVREVLIVTISNVLAQLQYSQDNSYTYIYNPSYI
jgi:hypothetical protein